VLWWLKSQGGSTKEKARGGAPDLRDFKREGRIAKEAPGGGESGSTRSYCWVRRFRENVPGGSVEETRERPDVGYSLSGITEVPGSSVKGVSNTEGPRKTRGAFPVEAWGSSKKKKIN